MSSADTMPGLSAQLMDLLEHNRKMLSDAEANNWDKVIEADVLRQGMLERLYSSSDIHNVPHITSATREMLAINQQLEKLAESAKKVAVTEVASINKGNQAISAYEQNIY